jgi:predicted nucleotidyltransferase component of viral defense system
MQLKALLRNLAAEKNIKAEVLLRSFIMERILERISVSKYKNNFILKGGMLIASIIGIDARTTMDLDTTIKGQPLTERNLNTILENILNISIGDNIAFSLQKIEQMHKDESYLGYRVSIEAILDKTRQTLKIDITTGDPITPSEVKYNFRLMFEDRSIGLLAYNLETVLAEKLEAIVSRGITNTRMRDFYDIYVLTSAQTYDADIFRAALERTAEKRGTTAQASDAKAIVKVVASDPVMRDLWKRYQKKFDYASDIDWDVAIHAVKKLCN